MRYVLAVAETSNFTRAAEQCMVVQSALSRQVARLERELGAPLFERNSRHVRITPAGEAFVAAARASLNAAERAIADVAAATGEVRGRLALGLIPTVAAVDIPQALSRFRREHPSVQLNIRVGASLDLVEQVKQGVIEVAFLGLPTTARPEGVCVRKLGTDRLVAVVSPDHHLATHDVVTLAQLATETFIDLPAHTAGRAQSDEAFAAAGLNREVAFEVTTVDLMMVRLVKQGLGIVLLPSAYVPQLAGVVTIEIDDAPMRTEYLIWAGTWRTPAATAFLKLLDLPSTKTYIDSPAP